MTIPFHTTTVTVSRPTALADPMEPASKVEVIVGALAHISYPGGSEHRGTGSKRSFDATLFVDAGTDIQPQDQIVDTNTGVTWQVTWTRSRYGVGLDYCSAGLSRAEGSTS